MSEALAGVVLFTALVIDWMSVGPGSVRDRIAFAMAVPALCELINTDWLTDRIRHTPSS